ncbi:MAG: 5'/3'-nucleotidase SurE [Acidimicrobiales bacterium]
MRILVTNDDGIDSIGLHALARAMVPFGEVVIVAPATEYSGAGAALGTITFEAPIVRSRTIEGLEDLETWSVDGPPALCTMYAQLGVFGEPFDWVVSGINPGQNVGWSVYHSGTIGATLTGRNRGASGLAVSLGFDGREVEGQTWEEIVDGMNWDMGAEVAATIFEGLIAENTDEPVVVSANIPNGTIDRIKGWSEGRVGTEPPRRAVRGTLVEAGADDEGQIWKLEMDWGSKQQLVEGTDGWLVANKQISITWLGHLTRSEPAPGQLASVGDRLDELLG